MTSTNKSDEMRKALDELEEGVHSTNREELLNRYIDAHTRLEQCGRLRKQDIGRSLQNELYDHEEHLEEECRELRKALREISDAN